MTSQNSRLALPCLALILLLAPPAAAWADDPGLPPAPTDAPAAPDAPVVVPDTPPAPLPDGAPAALSGPAQAAAPKGDLPLAFKGLRLGMSQYDLKAFVDGQPGLRAGAAESLNGVTKVTLYRESPGRRGLKKAAASDDFFTIGCVGPERCYTLQSAVVVFLNDQAVSFSLKNIWTVDEARDADGLKGWTDFVVAAFNQKYGNPVTVHLAPTQQDISDVLDLGNAAPFVQWNSGRSRVLLEVSRSGDHCKATIEVQDVAGSAQLLRKDSAGR